MYIFYKSNNLQLISYISINII